MIDKSFDDALVEALETLSLNHQPVVQLVDVLGLSYAEAARVLGIPEGTVMSHLHRARKRSQLTRSGLTPHGPPARASGSEDRS